VDVATSKPELLAPAGRPDVLEAVVESGADAVYLGGKNLNMRLHRADLNFTRDELSAAIAYARERGVGIYVTLNNLYWEDEIGRLAEELEFLDDAGPDGLIVQDLGVLKLMRDMSVKLPVHSSVMMNVHNLEMIRELRDLGVSRTVVAREIPLDRIRSWKALTGMEFECFVHGETCVAWNGLCYLSGAVFGESSNRGRCHKPCRWRYSVVDLESGRELAAERGPYVLASKDLCLLPFIPRLITSGITSFKIEGRMRGPAHLAKIVRAYRRAIDRYLSDPTAYRVDRSDWAAVHRSRRRDLCTGFTFGNPGASFVRCDGRREPPQGWLPARVKPLTLEALRAGRRPASRAATGIRPRAPEERDSGPPRPPQRASRPLLSVKAGSPEGAQAALDSGADVVYAGLEVEGHSRPLWTMSSLLALVRRCRSEGRSFVLDTPSITTDHELAEYRELLSPSRWGDTGRPDGVLAGNLGMLRLARRMGMRVYADFTVNVGNGRAAAMLQRIGAERITASVELSANRVEQLLRASPVPVECVVHGPLPAFTLEYCIPSALLSNKTKDQLCPGPCRRTRLALVDELGQRYRVRTDRYCRNYVFMPRDLCCAPFLERLVRAGAAVIRIEGWLYDPDTVSRTVALYRSLVDRIARERDAYRFPDEAWTEVRSLEERSGAGFWAGAYA